MWIEIALLMLIAGVMLLVLRVALSDGGPIEPDGGDDPGPIGLVLAIYGSWQHLSPQHS